MGAHPERPAALNDRTSARFARTKGRDTKPERELRSLLHARGIRFYVDRAPDPNLRRRADILFPRQRIAVFVDGCFFHGCPIHGTWPKHNAVFWRRKIETNIQRDRDTDERLRALGWQVVRIWEHEDPRDAADRVEQIVKR